ncbi:MAG: hypothetical protein ACN6RA_14770 [Stenotrophomonas maltophilia]
MSDDRFKDAGQFEPEKAWSDIQKADQRRSAGERHPMRMRDYLIVAGGAIALIGIPLIVISFFL